ncbi:MAG: hypothetical protein COV72_01855 [Candidatus Omnitrophica bacterium CG11_big_fil_rev_8_21_14_0_20_42_13]|uniref:Uncharacterized protein n=1 Tax=Candidatus Ghiorseimicrobium undicola TaxID=1974746 RepID=A0A2H0LZ35_9BACT|nr:MAG: hypothetical protein COV72_01855 [Candidatus Omnitrophica bacterium CG11_big_fil_rev_8_21_14_0_20_42_13]
MKTIKMIGITAAVLFIFTGCSSYRLSSEAKSMHVETISPNIFTVQFCGNAFMTQSEAEKYAFQRAAEAALSKGYSHFIVVEKRDDSEFCALPPKGPYDSTVPARSMESVPDEPNSFIRPNILLRIQCFSRNDELPDSAIDARQFLSENFPGLGEFGE